MSDETTDSIDTIDVPDDDQLLQYSQKVRLGFVRHVTAQGTAMPDDPKLCTVMLKALSDIDKQVISKKRLVVEEKGNAENAHAISEMASKILQIAQTQATPTPSVPREIVLDETGMEPLKVVEGETTVGLANENWDGFNKRTKPDTDKSSDGT